ncbi:hypothetical protein JTB14_001447 [Gonioctena quinquepunctata]|nr:hypothetical protein JTB14_001447 [Gonioctena quinquepunctata]
MEDNEAVDSLAKEGAAKGFIGPEPALDTFPSFAKQTLNTWTARRVSDFWCNLPGLDHSRAFITTLKKFTKYCYTPVGVTYVV